LAADADLARRVAKAQQTPVVSKEIETVFIFPDYFAQNLNLALFRILRKRLSLSESINRTML
jgi:hypothetical protein